MMVACSWLKCVIQTDTVGAGRVAGTTGPGRVPPHAAFSPARRIAAVPATSGRQTTLSGCKFPPLVDGPVQEASGRHDDGIGVFARVLLGRIPFRLPNRVLRHLKGPVPAKLLISMEESDQPGPGKGQARLLARMAENPGASRSVEDFARS